MGENIFSGRQGLAQGYLGMDEATKRSFSLQ